MANMTARDPSRSALMAAGQSSLLSPRPDFTTKSSNKVIDARPSTNKVIDAQPVYATSYPFPGASTLVKNTYPDTNLDANAASLQQTVNDGNMFRQISPRSRADRRTVESKDELARQRCIQRNDGFHRLPHRSNYNYHNPFDLGEEQPSTWVGNVDDRYAQNAGDMLRAQQDDKRLQTVQHRDARRDKIMTEEAERWTTFDSAATKDRQKWDDIRAESMKAKANLSSLPYDPVTLRTKDSIDGLQYEYEEGLMKYREQLRSKNLYGKYNANGFNPVNGTPLFMGDMPQRPPNVQELALQRDANKNVQAIQLIKFKIIERGGINAIRNIMNMYRSMDANGSDSGGGGGGSGGGGGGGGGGATGTIDRNQFVQGLELFGIVGLSIDQVDDIINAFENPLSPSGSGIVDLNEMARQIRGPMTERRIALIQQAWMAIDQTGTNSIVFQNMIQLYNVSGRPDVMEGSISESDAMQNFIQGWNQPNGDSIITWEEFASYYMDVSAAMDDDVTFDAMVRATWRLEGSGGGGGGGGSSRRVLLIHKSGQMTVREVPGGVLPNNMAPAALMNEIKRRFRDAGVQFLDIKMSE